MFLGSDNKAKKLRFRLKKSKGVQCKAAKMNAIGIKACHHSVFYKYNSGTKIQYTQFILWIWTEPKFSIHSLYRGYEQRHNAMRFTVFCVPFEQSQYEYQIFYLVFKWQVSLLMHFNSTRSLLAFDFQSLESTETHNGSWTLLSGK